MIYKTYNYGIYLSGDLHSNGGRGGVRKSISRFSDASKKRLGWVYMQGPWLSMMTFTYHNNAPSDFKLCKRQINGLLQNLRNRTIKYLWVMEYQQRGMVHFHIWLDKRYKDCPLWEDELESSDSWRPIMMNWLRISGQEKDQKAVDFHMNQEQYINWKINPKVNYAKKYAEKLMQKVLPEGVKGFGRWWGCSANLVLEKTVQEVNSFCDNAIEDWKMFRRITKKYIEKISNFKFNKDVQMSRCAIRWKLEEKQLKYINILADYYIKNNC